MVIHSEHNNDWRPQPLHLVADGDGNRAGPIRWGSGATSSLLFASSEGSTEDILVGPASHKAFDIVKQAPSITFDLQEDGDGLAVDPSGLSPIMLASLPGTHIHSNCRRQTCDLHCPTWSSGG